MLGIAYVGGSKSSASNSNNDDFATQKPVQIPSEGKNGLDPDRELPPEEHGNNPKDDEAKSPPEHPAHEEDNGTSNLKPVSELEVSDFGVFRTFGIFIQCFSLHQKAKIAFEERREIVIIRALGTCL